MLGFVVAAVKPLEPFTKDLKSYVDEELWESIEIHDFCINLQKEIDSGEIIDDLDYT